MSCSTLGRPGPRRPLPEAVHRTLLGLPEGERVEGTAGAAAWAVAHGVHAVRVHDVKEIVRVVRVVDAIARSGR